MAVESMKAVMRRKDMNGLIDNDPWLCGGRGEAMRSRTVSATA